MVWLGVMLNPLAIILSQHRLECGRLEIDDDITIPQVKGAFRKRVPSRSCSSTPMGREVEGREKINLAKTSDFLDLVVVNTKLNSCRMTIHLEYFHPNN